VTIPPPGTVVAWWEHDAIAFGVVVTEEKQRVVLVTADGREERVAPARVVASLASGPAPGRTPEGRREAAATASAMAEVVADRSAAVDVATLWDLTKGDAATIGEETLASLALASGDAPACLATALALARDGVRFVRKASGWQPRGEEAVAEIVTERENVARRAEEKSAVFTALGTAWREGVFRASGTSAERRVLAALEALAVLDLDAPEKERAQALEALQAAGARGDRPAEAAFRLLRRTGRFSSDDQNLAIVRFGLRTAFSEDTVLAAEAAARAGYDRSGRRDLTGRLIVTIDDAATRELDDALSIEERENGLVEIGIHIADPCAFIVSGGAVDVEARARGTTYYFPEGKLLMIPPVLSEGAASLVAGQDRPALSFLVAVDAEGRAAGVEIVRSIVRIDSRLDYDEVDARLRDGSGAHAPLLTRLAAVSARREELRRTAGAIALRAPETEIRVAADGSLALTRRDPNTPAQRLVSEAMVLAGEVAAAWLDARRVPAVYRRQSAPDGRLPDADPSQPDAVHIRAMRRQLKRGEAGLHPAPHHALGLNAYTQVTSPLRRYQDLAMHRQIVRVLSGQPPEYDAAAMQALLAATERAESDGKRAERAMDRYFMLRWLERSQGGTVTGVVVDVMPRPIVVLDETLLEQVVPSLVAASTGDRVRLRVERVNPRADLLVLRPA
jgi:exoribonuclease-2